MGKPLELVVIRVIGVEVKEVSDQPVIISGVRKSVCSLARLSSLTSGSLEDEFWGPLPPEASEMPFKREPEAVSSLPLVRKKGETLVTKGCQLGSKPKL
jgi:hypothetical protein